MLKIYDVFGAVQTEAWLVLHYGPLVVWPAIAGPGWRVTELREDRDVNPGMVARARDVRAAVFGVEELERGGLNVAACIIVKHLMYGLPVDQLRAAWYWRDAPFDANGGPVGGLPAGMFPDRCVFGQTNGNGDVGHPMGGGAYYFPPAMGPHAVWVYGKLVNSDVVYGLGMIGGTNHNHINVVYEWSDDVPPPPPPPPPGELGDVIRAALDAVVDVQERVAVAKAGLEEALELIG
jgi:hypothetical protein